MFKENLCRKFLCLELTENRNADFVTFVGMVSKEFEGFKPKELTENQFKCLIFVLGLK